MGTSSSKNGSGSNDEQWSLSRHPSTLVSRALVLDPSLASFPQVILLLIAEYTIARPRLLLIGGDTYTPLAHATIRLPTASDAPSSPLPQPPAAGAQLNAAIDTVLREDKKREDAKTTPEDPQQIWQWEIVMPSTSSSPSPPIPSSSSPPASPATATTPATPSSTVVANSSTSSHHWVSEGLAKSPLARGSGAVTAVINDIVYVTGGLFTKEGNRYVTMYEPAANRWTKRTANKFGLFGAAAAVVKDVWVLCGGMKPVGGLGNGEGNGIVNCYDPSIDQISSWPELREPRFGAVAACVNNTWLVVTGGSRDSHGDIINMTEVMNVTDEETIQKGWSKSGKLHVARAFAAICTVPHGILVAGGTGLNRDELISMELWEPHTKKWKLLAMKLPIIMHRSSLHYIDAKLFIIGSNLTYGMEPGVVTTWCVDYDLVINSTTSPSPTPWVQMNTLPVKRIDPIAVVVT